MKKNIKLNGEDWEDLCAKIDNEGFGYFVTDYTNPEGFGEMVGEDKKAVELFKKAQDSMKELSDYIGLGDF